MGGRLPSPAHLSSARNIKLVALCSGLRMGAGYCSADSPRRKYHYIKGLNPRNSNLAAGKFQAPILSFGALSIKQAEAASLFADRRHFAALDAPAGGTVPERVRARSNRG